jgi:hypothetical protein
MFTTFSSHNVIQGNTLKYSLWVSTFFSIVYLFLGARYESWHWLKGPHFTASLRSWIMFLCSITEWLVLLCRELQYNLIRSHAAGVGTPLNPEKTRMLLALRINVLAKGHSGISLTNLYALIKAFNGTWKYSFTVVLIKMWYSKYCTVLVS